MAHQRTMRRFSWCVIALLLVLAALPAASSHTEAGRQYQAGLIVQLSPDEVITQCVSFAEAQISGLDLLKRSGLEVASVEVASVDDERYGAFICGIAGVGCPAERCLCAYPPRYWQYWLLGRTGWQVSPVGASGRIVRDGDVDGWIWRSGMDDMVFDQRFSDPCVGDTSQRVYLPLVQR